jgi:hypothetical protein
MPKQSKLIVLAVFFLLSASFVLALENQYPQIQQAGGKDISANAEFLNFVAYFFYFAIGIGVAAVFAIAIWSGFRYLPSRDDPAIIADIQEKLRRAFLGLLVLVSTYMILHTINPQLVEINIPPLSTGGSSPQQGGEVAVPEGLTMQEIPLGTIVESLLTGNAATSTGSIPRCYEYDSEGNTKDQNKDGKIDEQDLKGYNRFYCVRLINEAFQIKLEKARQLVELLKSGIQSCSCYRCQIIESQQCEIYDAGKCTACRGSCVCCGNSRGKDKLCEGTDPCPQRQNIDCTRQKIQQLLDGTRQKDGKDSTDQCYDPGQDPKATQTFLTLEEASFRMSEFYQAFLGDLNGLKEAEIKMISTDTDGKITLSEYLYLTQKHPLVGKTNFKDYNSTIYCAQFSCSLDPETKRMCQRKENEVKKPGSDIVEKQKTDEEWYLKNGDQTTFYYNDQYKKDLVSLGEPTKYTMDINEEKIDENTKIQKALIPIGEMVDEAKAFGEQVAFLFNIATEHMGKVKSTIEVIKNLPEGCGCTNCSKGSPCSYPVRCSGDNDCSDPFCVPCSLPTTCSPPKDYKAQGWRVDTACGGWYWEYPYKPGYYVCPIDDFEREAALLEDLGEGYDDQIYTITKNQREQEKKAGSVAASIKMQIKKGKEDVQITVPYNQIFEIFLKKAADLMTGENLKPGDPDKCPILDKLTLSRKKVEECYTGFGAPTQVGAVVQKVMGCRNGWDLVRTAKITITPGFPVPQQGLTYINCYPFNGSFLTDAQKNLCLANKDSIHCTNRNLGVKELENCLKNNPGCQELTGAYLDNYYCIQGTY